jgi:hypothetical protein
MDVIFHFRADVFSKGEGHLLQLFSPILQTPGGGAVMAAVVVVVVVVVV